MTGRIPNGATHLIDGQVSCKGGKPGELKHLINRRKRKQKVIPSVVASERGIAQTCFVATLSRGCRTAVSYLDCEKNVLERTIIEGDNPVFEA